MGQRHGHAVPSPDERQRAQQALTMRKAGGSWVAIADVLNYADESGPRRAVSRLLDRVDAELAAEYRALELSRLDDLWRAWWPAALQRDEKAANIVLRVHQARAKLLGLAVPETLVLQQFRMDMSPEEFTTRTAEDMRLLGLHPTGDTPLVVDSEDAEWSNT